MIKIDDCPARILKDICNEHYIGVLPIVQHQLATANIPVSLRNYLQGPGRLEAIIKGKPSDLIQEETQLDAFCSLRRISRQRMYLKRVFKYGQFSSKNTQPYNAYHLASALNVRACVYCNRQYTFTVVNTEEVYCRPDFDHFFAKSDHPLLALSFYNLIPSCLLCNRVFKQRKPLTYGRSIHPYEEGFGTAASFNYDPKDRASAIGLGDKLDVFLEVKEDARNKKKIERNMKVFRLNETYEGHADYVSEIVRKFYISNADYLQSLHEAFPSIGSKEELYRIAIGNYLHERDHDKRILSKLAHDIAAKLGLLSYLNKPW